MVTEAVLDLMSGDITTERVPVGSLPE